MPVCALALAACGGSDEPGGGDGGRPEGLPPGFNLQAFTCGDWRRANDSTRDYVVRRFREINGGEVDGTRARGAVMPDEKAKQLFDTQCAQPVAQSFVLFKLYGTAAGFVGGP